MNTHWSFFHSIIYLFMRDNICYLMSIFKEVIRIILNILIGLIMPWLFGIHLYKKDPNVLLGIFPIGTVLSHIINSLAYEHKIWFVHPQKYIFVDVLLFDIGLYSILPSFMIYLIHKYRKGKSLYILGFTLFTTFSEYLWLKSGRVSYDNGWNIYFTFLSYLFPYIFVYLYYLLLKKKKIIQ